jgi:hypothetical protein
MNDRILNFAFPITGGSLGSVGIVFTNITWIQAGDLALQAAIAAIVGACIGYATKRLLDIVFRKKKEG